MSLSHGLMFTEMGEVRLWSGASGYRNYSLKIKKKKSVRNEKYIKKCAFHRYTWNSYILDSKQWENADLPVDYRNGNTLLEAREQNQNTIKWLAVPAGGNRRVQALEDRLASLEGRVITKWETDWRDVALGQTGFTWWGVLVEGSPSSLASSQFFSAEKEFPLLLFLLCNLKQFKFGYLICVWEPCWTPRDGHKCLWGIFC